MSKVIQAGAASALYEAGALPDEIVFLPEGEHKITPRVNGKAQEITIRVPADRGAEIAASLQADLEERQKDTVRPWLDFEHKRGKASALPKAFRYEPGLGVVLAVDWTGAGKAAVEGRDFSYFSPSFTVGDDGVPDGLTKRGPLGGLVNEPAFRKMTTIAASDADESHNHSDTMPKEIFAKLELDPDAEGAEQAAVVAIEAMQTELKTAQDEKATIEAKLADTEKERDDLKTQVEAADKERAEKLVEAAVVDGRIAPKDEETQKQFREKIEARDEFAEKILAGLPKVHQGIEKPIVNANDHKGDTETRVEAALAEASKELGIEASFQERWNKAKEIDPAAFTA